MTVKRYLDDMCKQLEDVMEERADEIFVKMKADYNRVLGGGQLPTGQPTIYPMQSVLCSPKSCRS